MEFVLLFVIGAAIVALVMYDHWLTARQRRGALAFLAASWGFRWEGGDDPFGIAERYDRFGAIRRGSDRSASNVFHGTRNGRPVVCFDYQYETGSGDSSKTHRLSGAILDLGVHTPRLLVRPEGFMDKLAELVGLDDIDFESAEFSRTFYVTASRRKFAFDVFHARAMDYMLALPHRYSMEFDGGLVMVLDDKVWGPSQFDEAIRQVEGLVALFPEYLRRALKEGAL
jgi:hypothetical protein